MRHRKVSHRNRRFKVIMAGMGIGLGSTILSLVAFAAWTMNATGSVSDKALTAQTLTIVANATPTADLYPGGNGAAQFTVTNTNPFAVTVTSITFGTVTSSDETNCPASNLTAVSTTVGSLSIAVPANGSSAAQSLSNAFLLATAAPNGCQGVTFTIAATGTVVQA